MEPSYNAPRMNPERAPSLPPVSPEVAPNANPETQVERGPQPFEQESRPQQQPTTPPTNVTPTLPQPVVDDSALSDDANAVLLTALPDVAADDDIIEKEWVNKAKHIIAETANDPYRREQAIAQLQKDYIRKRYNREIGTPDQG